MIHQRSGLAKFNPGRQFSVVAGPMAGMNFWLISSPAKYLWLLPVSGSRNQKQNLQQKKTDLHTVFHFLRDADLATAQIYQTRRAFKRLGYS